MNKVQRKPLTQERLLRAHIASLTNRVCALEEALAQAGLFRHSANQAPVPPSKEGK